MEAVSASASERSRSCSHSYQSSPINSQGCGDRMVPLPQHISSAGQNFSHPQQIRSGFFGFTGNLDIDLTLLSHRSELAPVTEVTDSRIGQEPSLRVRW